MITTKEFKEFVGDTVWIVTDIKGYNVELKKFFDFINPEVEKPASINLVGFLKSADLMVGPDGKPVDLSKGALLRAQQQDVEHGYGIHLANVGPSDEKGAFQYAIALSRLKLAPRPAYNPDMIAGDGQFRLLGVDNEIN